MGRVFVIFHGYILRVMAQWPVFFGHWQGRPLLVEGSGFDFHEVI
jgi:hypothetical protein